jgi:hypothetical protein
MKKFTVQCDFGGQRHPVQVYIGQPRDDKHPLQNQAHWLSSEKGGNIPAEVMESFTKLQNIAKENGVDFEELCMYALGQASDQK